MEYVLLIYANEPEMQARSEAEWEELYAGYRAFNAAVREAGVFREARRLDYTHSATTQRVRDGQVLTTDGPFAETKEQLAGFYLIDCEDLDAALEWGARLPGARVGSVEVRPVAY